MSGKYKGDSFSPNPGHKDPVWSWYNVESRRQESGKRMYMSRKIQLDATFKNREYQVPYCYEEQQCKIGVGRRRQQKFQETYKTM